MIKNLNVYNILQLLCNLRLATIILVRTIFYIHLLMSNIECICCNLKLTTHYQQINTILRFVFLQHYHNHLFTAKHNTTTIQHIFFLIAYA